MVSKACCTNPLPQSSAASECEYCPKGRVHRVGAVSDEGAVNAVDVYEVGDGRRFAFCVYDIFGFEVPSSFQLL